MAVPQIHRLEPVLGPTSGGNTVRIVGEGFTPEVLVGFGSGPAQRTLAWMHAGAWTLDVVAPPQEAGAVDLRLENLTPGGAPVPGEIVVAQGAYEYLRPQLIEESDLARLIRTLLRSIKREVLANTHVAVHVDHDDSTGDGLRITTMAALPSLVLAGPSIRPSSAYRTSEPIDVEAAAGEVLRQRQRLTVDLAFTLTGASSSTVELINLLTAAARFISRTPWIGMLRDPARPQLGLVRWDLDAEGEWRTQIPGSEGVHAFSAAFVVRGFDLDEGLVRERVRRVETVLLDTGATGAPGAH